MENITNIQEATEYVYEKLKETRPELNKNDVYDSILDEMMAASEFMMMDDDDRFLEDNANDPQAIDEYLQSKLPNYHEQLIATVEDLVGEEIVEE